MYKVGDCIRITDITSEHFNKVGYVSYIYKKKIYIIFTDPYNEIPFEPNQLKYFKPFKIGDKVQIIRNLKYRGFNKGIRNQPSYQVCVDEYMCKHIDRNKIYTILKIDDCVYSINDNTSRSFVWSNDLLLPANEIIYPKIF